MIKADDDVMVAVEELIDTIKGPSFPSAFMYGNRVVNRDVIRDTKAHAKW